MKKIRLKTSGTGRGGGSRRRGLGFGLFLALLVGGCSGSGSDVRQGGEGGFAELTPEAAVALLAERSGAPGFVVLDVRTPAEYSAERIDGAINVDFHGPRFRDRLAELDRDATYLLYCRTGNRSGQSLATFRDLGFRDVRHLTRGITAWKAAGEPVVRGGGGL